MARPVHSGPALPPHWPGMRVGLYGGSFNPVHGGHVHVARTAKKRLNLDCIWWLVSPGNPLKEAAGTKDYDKRCAAVTALTATMPGHRVCGAEKQWGTRYSADFLDIFLARAKAVKPVWIMGADSLKNFHLWKDWRGIASALPLAVIARNDEPLRARLSPAAQVLSPYRHCAASAKTLSERESPAWVYLDAPFHPAASRDIRAQTGRA